MAVSVIRVLTSLTAVEIAAMVEHIAKNMCQSPKHSKFDFSKVIVCFQGVDTGY